jgi:hypothetical protein
MCSESYELVQHTEHKQLERLLPCALKHRWYS